MPPEDQQSKADIRRRMLGARGTSPASGPGLLAVARAHPRFATAEVVALYVASAGEPSTGPLIDWLLAAGTRVLLPVLQDDDDLGWGVAPGPDGAGLVRGRLGLRQPPTDLGVEAIAGVDLVICPAVAVDRTGVRLGRGGGSYDRALARIPADPPSRARPLIWAAVHDTELLDHLPSEPHDRRVDAALTPSRLVRFG